MNNKIRDKKMKGLKVLIVLCGTALLIAGCAVPLGEDYQINRDGSDVIYIDNYDLQKYVPIPRPGEAPITLVNQGDLEIIVVWKDNAGTEIPLPFDSFLSGTVYQAEIRIRAKYGYGFYPSTSFAYAEGKITLQTDDQGDPDRLVQVTYNNSDDADITFITDYNLQSYVPIPVAEELWSQPNRGDVTVTAVWSREDPPNGFVPITADSFTFQKGAVYQAEIRLRVNSGYRFRTTGRFDYPNGTVSTRPLPNTHSEDRALSVVEYKETRAPIVINDLNLTPYIPKPIRGVMPLTSFAGSQYTGTMSWKIIGTPAIPAGFFQAETEYTAEVNLIPAMGYTFRGIGQNVFTHTGAETGTITNSPGSGTIHIRFPATGKAGSLTVVYDTTLTGYISRPIEGVSPVRVINGNQYTGTVTWTPSHSTFQKDTEYTAELALKAAAGYTFAGIGENIFTHRDAPPGAVTNLGGSGTVSISFPAAATSANPAMTFGPAGTENSALWILKENRDYIYPYAIDLPGGSEPIFEGATLVASDTSPAAVIINGNGRILNVNSGVLLTVGNGVTLTLRNITFQGINGNTTPLIKVWAGGKLILEEGAVFTGNKTAGDVGGVWVNGGVLILNEGAEIKGMAARQGGGALIDADGKCYMYGGTIGGEPIDGNTVSGENGGGGVLIANGSFNMYGGTIRSNAASNTRSGGGVCVLDGGTFNQYAGSIKGNIAQGTNSGGGVCLSGEYFASFVMNASIAVIEENIAQKANSGGGVYIADNGIFIMNNGTIQNNTAWAVNSGGGICYDDGDLQMYRGTILKNEALAADSGGGMYIDSWGVGIYNVSIRENTARGSGSGGGVYIGSGGNMSMTTDGTIESNIAKGHDSGGGVYVTGKYENRGVIKNNIVEGKQSGGGVYVTGPELNWPDNGGNLGIIKGNKALYSSGTAADSGSGGGVYIGGGGFTNGGTIGGENPEDSNIALMGANGVYCAGGDFGAGGKITGNTGGGNNNYGVYIKSVKYCAFSLAVVSSGSVLQPVVTQDNLVFLSPGASIRVANAKPPYPYTSYTGPALANITCDDPNPATKLINDTYLNPSHLNYIIDYFLFNGAPVSIKLGNQEDLFVYGYYNGSP